ncbi:MAG: glycosyl hydrolase 108 family protein [Sphingobium sp.]|nr:glycosyl hydrolase 108 family protein [Sphingobium sp.]
MPPIAAEPTNWGITQALARKGGYQGDMRDLPRSRAFAIYWQQFVIARGSTCSHRDRPRLRPRSFGYGRQHGCALGRDVPAARTLNALQRAGPALARTSPRSMAIMDRAATLR